MSFYVAGMRLESAGGMEWRIEPLLGDLRIVEAGFETELGTWESSVRGDGEGKVTGLRFCTPRGTMGSVVLNGVEGVLRSEDGESVQLVNGVAEGLKGGNWTLIVKW